LTMIMKGKKNRRGNLQLMLNVKSFEPNSKLDSTIEASI
jgi:hypothetical protein